MAMNHLLKIKKGLDLKIEGGVTDTAVAATIAPQSIAIVPDDFPGFTPKTEVNEGDEVAAGAPLLFDKRHPDIKLVSPVTGKVEAIVRGARRKIERVVVTPATADESSNSLKQPVFEGKWSGEATALRLKLQQSGLWAMMRQRPYDIVPDAEAVPRDIFITAMDTAPLAIDPAAFLCDKKAELVAGVALLKKLTPGKVYVARHKGSKLPDIEGAEMIDVTGPHPAGNVGTHIANIAPVNKGETVWTLDAVTLWRIGAAAISGKVPATTLAVICGSEVTKPCVVEATVGSDVASLLENNVKDDHCHHRIISGNVLTGIHIAPDGYLRYPYRQVTVIPEGDDSDEFMGWASLSPKKMSLSRTFPGHFFHKIFNPDARLNGSKRAFIMSGEYDRYIPMDIMAEYLLKAIMGHDIEQMEKLGIYEVAPEDFALGEYADTSKIEAQKIVREGLDYLRKELE